MLGQSLVPGPRFRGSNKYGSRFPLAYCMACHLSSPVASTHGSIRLGHAVVVLKNRRKGASVLSENSICIGVRLISFIIVQTTHLGFNKAAILSQTALFKEKTKTSPSNRSNSEVFPELYSGCVVNYSNCRMSVKLVRFLLIFFFIRKENEVIKIPVRFNECGLIEKKESIKF